MGYSFYMVPYKFYIRLENSLSVPPFNYVVVAINSHAERDLNFWLKVLSTNKVLIFSWFCYIPLENSVLPIEIIPKH